MNVQTKASGRCPAPREGCFGGQEELQALKARLPLADLVRRYSVKLIPSQQEFKGLCPFHAEKTPSFTVVPQGGFYHCFGCGANGDHFDFLQAMEGLTFNEAKARLRELVGLEGVGRPAARALRAVEQNQARARAGEESAAAKTARRRDYARALWRAAGPADGTLVESYLRARGINIADLPDGRVPPSLRFHAALDYPYAAQRGSLRLPAMIGLIQAGPGEIIGVHRTFLDPSGAGKADVGTPKMMLGKASGGAVRFAKAGPRLMIAEGIETALSVLAAQGGRPCALPIWAALSLGNFAAIDLPRGVQAVTILADGDGKDPAINQRILAEATRRFQNEGRFVRLAKPGPGLDFNDVLARPEGDPHGGGD